MDALVLTEDRAEANGYTGAGPFTFGGVFPGEWIVGEPLSLRRLGFADRGQAEEALEEALGGRDADTFPLTWTTVAEGEGEPDRDNHLPSELEVAQARASDAKGGSTIRSHADADKVAAEVGIAFPAGASLGEKRTAIDDLRAAASGPVVPRPIPPGDPDEQAEVEQANAELAEPAEGDA